MLNEIQKNKFKQQAKEAAQNLLKELNISKLDENSVCELQKSLDLKVASLVSAKEAREDIDNEQLETFDLLVDIILDNEDNLDFLNHLFNS